MKNLLFFFTILPSFVFAQAKLTQVQLDEYALKLKANPVETVKKYTHKDFTFINGKGIRVGYNELVANYTFNKETLRKLTDVKITQVNQTASVTGKVEHEWHSLNDPNKVSKYSGMFTYVYVNEGGTWKIISAQHTDYQLNKEEGVAIMKVIEGHTQASYDRNLEKALSYWANVPHASYVRTSLNANLTGFEQIKNTYTVFAKANPTPDKSKIETTYKSITIKGNTAFVKHEEAFTSEKGITTKQNCHRYLERINNEWKLVGSVVTPMPTVKTDDEAAIKKVIEAETQAYLDGDGKKLLSFWADKKTNESASQNLVPILGQPYAKGASMEKLQNEVVPNLKKQNATVERNDFEIRLNKDMAWATFNQITTDNGTGSKTERGTRILERINGEWKIVYVGGQVVK